MALYTHLDGANGNGEFDCFIVVGEGSLWSYLVGRLCAGACVSRSKYLVGQIQKEVGDDATAAKSSQVSNCTDRYAMQ